MRKFVRDHTEGILQILPFLIIIAAIAYIVSVELGGRAGAINTRAEDTSPVLIEDVAEETVSDESAPAGVRRVFRFTLDTKDRDGISLIFYVHNSWAQVSIDGESVYRYEGDLSSVSTSGAGAAWVMIPLYDTDAGAECVVTITPVYTYAIENTVAFYMGEPHQLNQLYLSNDAIAILACVICFVVGFLFLAMAAVEHFSLGSRRSPMGWLGLTAILMATWKLLDMRSFSLFMPWDGTVQYIASLCSLSLAPFAAVLYVRQASTAIPRKLMNVIALYMAAICIFQIVCQAAGIFTLRQTLPLTHIDIVIAYLLTIAEPILSWKQHHNPLLLVLPFIVTVGALLDLAFYFKDSLSQNIRFSLIAMSVYIIFSGVRYLYSIQARSYVDGMTGLFNQRRCSEEKCQISVETESPGIVMMDLNGLKRVNDHMGHAQGDAYIRGFAGVLQRSAGRGITLYRAGGDEFVAILPHATKESLERFYTSMHQELDAWNRENPGFDMSVSCGAALSVDHPGLSIEELSDLADAAMYADKDAFYKRTGIERRTGEERRSEKDRRAPRKK